VSSLFLPTGAVQAAAGSLPAKHSRFQTYQQVREEIAVQVRPIVEKVLSESLDGEVDSLLGRGRYQRMSIDDQTVVQATCNKCGSQRRAHFRRGGHEERTLATLYGPVQIKTPRIECRCGGLAHREYLSVKPRARLWYDLKERIQELNAVAVSLRNTVELLARDIDVGLRAVNAVVNEAAELANVEQESPLEEVPPVVALDGISHRQMELTGQVKKDRMGRQRKEKRCRRGMTLIAYGIWPQSGRKEILDYEFGPEEDAESCQALLERLERRGLRAERGLQEVITDGGKGFLAALEMVDLGAIEQQRCIFHKIRNLAENLQGLEELTRQARGELRAEILSDGAWIYRAKSKSAAYGRMEKVCQKWKEGQPKAVESLRRDFEATLRYYDVQARMRAAGQEWPVQYLRTTSALERENRTLRHKRRQVGVYQSEAGLQASTYLVKERAEHHRERRPGSWIRRHTEAQMLA
jgi:transposase-like protein